MHQSIMGCGHVGVVFLRELFGLPQDFHDAASGHLDATEIAVVLCLLGTSNRGDQMQVWYLREHL
jgi:hypothetical protein